MAVAPSFEDFVGIGLAAAQTARNDLLLDVGDASHQFISAASAMADANVEYASRLYRQTFLDGNTGQQLVERVTDKFKELTKKLASQAGVVLTLSRATAAAGAGTVPVGTVVATAISGDGVRQEFELQADVYYGPTEIGAKTVQALSRQVGAQGNAAAGTLTRIVSALFDSTITSTNVAAAAGGADEETDDEYRSRARAYPGTLPRGTRAAVKLGSLGVPGVRNVTVSVDSLGIMTIYIADASGGSSPLLIQAVREELDNWVAAGAVFSVVGGEILFVNMTIALKLSRGRAADVTGLVQVAVEQEFNKLSAGGVVYLDAFTASIIDLDRTQFKSARPTTPAADVTPLAHQIPRLGTLTVVDA